MVRVRLPRTAYYYSAYPGMAPADVQSAVRLARECRAFARRVEAEEPGFRRNEIVNAFQRLQLRTRDCLGSTAPIPAGATFGPATATGMSNVVSVIPLLPGTEDAVLRDIAHLPTGAVSPFRDVDGTHFARLAVLDRRWAGYHTAHPFVLRNSWLLFAADFDGHFDEFESRQRRVGRRNCGATPRQSRASPACAASGGTASAHRPNGHSLTCSSHR